MISILVAYSNNRVIGKANDLPWHIPADLKRFKGLTTGHTVIMGRKTYQSIVVHLGHALPDRRNIVISNSLNDPPNDIEVAHSLEEAIEMTKGDKTSQDIFIVGGERVFRDALQADIVDKIYATEIDKDVDGDVYFPSIDKTQWRETSRENHQDGNYKYSFVLMEHQK
ncbi:MAG: dihydrofolate reductase [bacterium]|nr:dihydrofolate reductase [bacterium]